MKKALLGLLIVLMFSLCGCGEKPKTEEEIPAELQVHPDFWNVQEVAIEEFTVIKRQTDEKNKTDKVYVEVTAGNDKVECHLGYCLNYGLYDSGWILDSVSDFSDVEKKIIPKQGPSEEDAKKYLPEEGYTVKSIGEADLAAGTCVVEYEKVTEYPLVERIALYTNQFVFSEEEASWKSAQMERTLIENWEIEGHWQAIKPKDSFFSIPERVFDLYISNVDPSGFYADVVCNGEVVMSERRDNFTDPLVFDAGMTTYLVYLGEEEIKFSTDQAFTKIE